MMSSENVSKKIMQSFIDLVNMAKWLMDEKQQPSVTQELGRLFPSIRGTERREESSDLLKVGAGESSASAHSLPQNRRLKKCGDQKQHQRNH